jgi:hypothetical protein
MPEFQFFIVQAYLIIGLLFTFFVLLQSKDTIHEIKTTLDLDDDKFFFIMILVVLVWPYILLNIILAVVKGEL